MSEEKKAVVDGWWFVLIATVAVIAVGVASYCAGYDAGKDKYLNAVIVEFDTIAKGQSFTVTKN